ncbi:MAG: DUF2240 family protein [Thermoplasmata archaeon]|nr:DUF2240 family protein [Thermoplasmata archaeon]
MDPVEEIKAAISCHPKASEGGMSRDDLLLFFTIKQGWFSAEEARRIVDKAVELGLLAEEGDGELRMTFSLPSEMDPFFSPSDDLPDRLEGVSVEPPEADVVKMVVERMREAGVDTRKALGEINAVQKRCGLDTEVVALAYAKNLGVEVGDLVEMLKEGLSKGE